MKYYFLDMWDTFKANLSGAYKSWTLWFNAFMGLFVEIGLPKALETLPLLYGVYPNSIYFTLLVVILGGNVLLRFKTKKPLSAK